MKQGQGKNTSEPKREPRSHAVSETYTSQIGTALGNHATDNGKILPNTPRQMYEGRGLKAPMAGETSHRSGSQGKHR